MLPVVIAAIGVAIAGLNFVATHVWPKIRVRRARRSVTKSLVAPSLRDDEIESYCQYYVEPFVQDVDPMGAEEPRAVAGVKNTLFKTLDEMLDPTSGIGHIMLLADSGMGKTSALVSYCARHIRRRRRRFDVALILLSRKNALKHIEDVPNKKETILFLDAFDEDIRAVTNHQARLDELMDAAEDFFRVVITCRTQFFRTDEEIPRQPATVRVGQRRFDKLYLSPFTDLQTRSYLRKRYSLDLFKPFDIWRRRRANQIAEKIPHLSTRPLLLTFIDLLIKDPLDLFKPINIWRQYRANQIAVRTAHISKPPLPLALLDLVIDDPLLVLNPLDIWRLYQETQIGGKNPRVSMRPLVRTFVELFIKDSTVNYSFEIYEKMVLWWLDREQKLIGNEAQLERFCELLAVELFQGRVQREGERIPRSELTILAVQWGIPVEDRQLSEYHFSTRSLLNRDADGNYKFAHRSMLEYFYVRHYRRAPSAVARTMREIGWTGQMLTFYWEMLENQICAERTLPFTERNSNGDFTIEPDHVPFLIALTLHGLALLRSPKIANQRLKSILETATALTARILDSDGHDDPVISLINFRHGSEGYVQEPIAIHYQGRLLDSKDAPFLKNEVFIDDVLRSSFIPDIDADNYVHILANLQRIDAQWHTFIMPIKRRDRMVAMMVGGTSRPLAFNVNKRAPVIEILRLIGQYLYHYSEDSDGRALQQNGRSVN